MAGIGKMRSLTIQEKLEIIGMVESGKSIKDVSEQTGINRNSLHYILKHRNKIRDEVSKNPTLTRHKRIKQTKNPELEAAVLRFIYKSRENGEKLTGSMIKSIALETSIKMNIKNFGASNGWLFSFFKRNGLSMSDFNNKMNTSDEIIIMTELNDQNVSMEYKEEDIKDIQYEYTEEEIEEVENVDEYTEHVVENDWRTWCKFCGTTEQTEAIQPPLEESMLELYQLCFKLNPNYEMRSCQKCRISFEESFKFLSNARIVESMFAELEEQEKLNSLTDETIYAVRQQYLWEECISDENEQVNELIDEKQEEVYEEDYLDEAVTNFEQVPAYEVIEESSIDVCAEEENADELEKSRILQDEEMFVYNCHMCNESFERMCFLSNHTREVHKCLPQVACSCGKYLATWESLMAHKRKHSVEPTDWICDVCSASFQTKTGLSIHIKFKHSKKTETGELNDSTLKPVKTIEKLLYECHFCMKKLSNKYSLKDHILTVHEKQKTRLCHLCSKGFATRSNLRSHLLTHTTELIECSICNQVFKNKISLQSHKKIHKPKEELNFGCDLCDKRFHNRNHLRRHAISHSNEKNFRCSFDGCEAAYKWEKDLKNHESIHNGLKKNQCQFCERCFIDTANLRKHKLKQHQDELSELELKYGKRKSVI